VDTKKTPKKRKRVEQETIQKWKKALSDKSKYKVEFKFKNSLTADEAGFAYEWVASILAVNEGKVKNLKILKVRG